MAGYGAQEGRIFLFVRGELAEPASEAIVEGAVGGGERCK